MVTVAGLGREVVSIVKDPVRPPGSKLHFGTS